jgi:hypothetical protein
LEYGEEVCVNLRPDADPETEYVRFDRHHVIRVLEWIAAALDPLTQGKPTEVEGDGLNEHKRRLAALPKVQRRLSTLGRREILYVPRSTFLQRENPERWILSRKLDSLRRLTVPLMLNTQTCPEQSGWDQLLSRISENNTVEPSKTILALAPGRPQFAAPRHSITDHPQRQIDPARARFSRDIEKISHRLCDFPQILTI